jgi:hypothetical protein
MTGCQKRKARTPRDGWRKRSVNTGHGKSHVIGIGEEPSTPKQPFSLVIDGPCARPGASEGLHARL